MPEYEKECVSVADAKADDGLFEADADGVRVGATLAVGKVRLNVSDVDCVPDDCSVDESLTLSEFLVTVTNFVTRVMSKLTVPDVDAVGSAGERDMEEV